MLKIWFLVTLVIVVSVSAEQDHSRLDILTRILNDIYKTEHKREFQYIKYKASDQTLRVYFQVCVKGETSTPCKSDVSGHSVRVANKGTNAQVFYKYEASYLNTANKAPDKTYHLTGLTSGTVYKVTACETRNNGQTSINCNDGQFTAGTDTAGMQTGGATYDP